MLAPGTNIGQRYIIDRLLGQGGMSNLYIATDLRQGSAVRVIKEMTARYADPNEQKMAEQLFMREAQLLATLNHPHIPKVFDKFIFQGKYYLSMEYVQGEDLGKLIQDRGKIEEKWVAAWGSQMATVLYYLHRQNPPIVFRDVKPSNIMIVKDEVKLIDFGIARLFTNTKKGDTMRIGSPGYAPPEQYGGQTDPRSDIYALGVTLHHAATGYDPTISQTPFVIPPVRSLNPQLSAELEATIARATQLDPDKRFQNCLEMKRELQNVMRMHGMIVGSSVPFSTLNQAQAGAAASSATVSKLPPSMAQAAAAAVQAAAATPGTQPAAGAPTAAPANAPVPNAAAPTPATPPANPAPVKAKKGKGNLLAMAFILFGIVGAGVAAFQAPAEWRDAASQQVQRWIAMLPRPEAPGPELSDAQKVLLWGGSAAEACEALGTEARLGKATPEQQLDYQNAMIYASGKPIRRLAVVAPADLKLAEALVKWQRLSWEDSNREGRLTVVTLESVQDDWRAALRRSMSTKNFREDQPADALLIFPPTQRPVGWGDWLAGGPTVYLAGAKDPADPGSVQTLSLPATDFAELFQQLELGKALWLAKQVKAPSSLKSQDFQGPESLLPLLKADSKTLLVVDPDQLKQIESGSKLVGLRLLVLAPGGSLPQPPANLPAGIKLYALAQATQFSADPAVAALFSEGGPVQSEIYDTLGWVGTSLNRGARDHGLSWRSDRSGEFLPARWSLLEARGGRWYWLREAGGSR